MTKEKANRNEVVGLCHELLCRVAYEVVDVVHGVYCSLQKGLV